MVIWWKPFSPTSFIVASACSESDGPDVTHGNCTLIFHVYTTCRRPWKCCWSRRPPAPCSCPGSPPSPKGRNLKLFTYSLTLTPLTHYGGTRTGEGVLLPPSITSKLVGGLTEGDALRGPAVRHLRGPQQEAEPRRPGQGDRPQVHRVRAPGGAAGHPVGDDGLPPDEPPCNCSDTGMVACTRRPGFVECTCQPGYGGTWCEECAPGNFRAGKECVVCPCSNLTSTAECKMEPSGQVSCVQCLPGHRGSLCTSCSAGYQWTEERCAPDCLSSSLCARHRDAPDARTASSLTTSSPPPPTGPSPTEA
ncbi:laminin subunit alpha [Caerostris extrusa]|uniref:Laminin subunit alpha n=1 Tax=Caerostris extrusa TaxID=172846 RepID=A0AAV4W3U8_CAEEX|nr:laminin subunit alpha [Caerostris extrusa]